MSGTGAGPTYRQISKSSPALSFPCPVILNLYVIFAYWVAPFTSTSLSLLSVSTAASTTDTGSLTLDESSGSVNSPLKSACFSTRSVMKERSSPVSFTVSGAMGCFLKKASRFSALRCPSSTRFCPSLPPRCICLSTASRSCVSVITPFFTSL